jgi:hypothetical protein
MQPDAETTTESPDVNHGMDVVGNSEANGSFHQAEEGLFKV